jgi:hypothetical protein
VSLGGVTQITVSREPRDQFDVDQNVWIGIDPRQMSLMADADSVVTDAGPTDAKDATMKARQ